MNDRERILNLMRSTSACICMSFEDCSECKYADEIGCYTAAVADHLIANGVTVQKQGRWVHDINNLYGCSECLCRETMSHKRLKSYCPNCGAKMSGGEDAE